LAAGDELQELGKSGFYTRGPTVLVSTLFNHTHIVQIHEKGLYLLTPGKTYAVDYGNQILTHLSL
jgi:cleavage and polyadenylation specificity factor subunit 1